MKKDSNKKLNEKNTVQNANDNLKMPFMTRFVCIFLSIVIVFGGVVGAMLLAKNVRAVAKYDGVTIDEGTAVYLASRYKALYMRELSFTGITPIDTPAFWASEDKEGVTYGERLERGLRDYIAAILAANSLFNTHSRLTKEDTASIAASIDEVLKYTADGSKSRFNELTEEYGFDYGDFECGTELLYKAQRAEIVIYGYEGAALPSYPKLCEEYLGEYTHVALMFMRTETKLLENDDGSLYEVDMTHEEKQARAAEIEYLRAHISARAEGDTSRDWITPEMFNIYLQKSDGDKEMHSIGYYLHPSAETTVMFAGDCPDVVDVALGLEIGEYGEAEYEAGVCFIYRYETVDGAYSNTKNSFFSDFYADAADYHYTRSLDALSTEAVFTESYGLINVVAIPKNTTYYVKEWV